MEKGKQLENISLISLHYVLLKNRENIIGHSSRIAWKLLLDATDILISSNGFQATKYHDR